MGEYVNHGGPVVWVTRPLLGGTYTSALHDGPDGHQFLQAGEQCECGVLGLGLVRKESHE